MTKSFVLSKCCFDDFLSILKELGPVHAPVRVSDQSFSFRKVESAGEIALEAIRTILPPKKFFYPQRETLISYDANGIYEHEPPMEFMTLFGVHPCDLAGLGIMDTIYSAAPADTHYLRRREACLVIGLSCMPDKHCFCQSMGTANAEKGYDIFFTDIGDDFFLEAVTPMAVKVMNSAASIVKAVTPEYMEAYKGFWQRRSEAFTNGFAADNLHSLMDLEIDNKVWDELGSRCLSCGNCTPVCPTCYCFDLVDIASLHEDSGERVREWDSCQFTGFAKVSGDFNFRPTPVDRFKFWYRHKLHGFDDPYGFKTCVGCGRCTVSCPSGIDDIVAVVKTLQASKENDKASDN